jgi:diacylglycerol kinase (ATP)
MKRLYEATLNSLHGFVSAFRREAAVREEIIALLLALPVGLWVAPSAAWYVAMIGVLLALIAVELLNTAIEKLADHVAPERNPKIGVLKDYGSAAVFCGLSLAALVWIAALAIRLGLI